ncbi:Breast cancer 2, early onset [Halocaridina rubra]|uniref:Breast cancer 2, early onset n=1 Tax=Halocaridina rubra TaxID=373956 RepID=A0AAN8XAI7_HALRR
MQEITPGAHKITGDNAKLYRFPVRDESVTVDCGEGCHIIPGKDECIGAAEVEQGFFCMPGVQPKFLPQGWVANHYRWIVWKLAALERRLIQRKLLTIENVIARLKYRYDREIDRVERPIIRKITEHDDTPQKTMVLCIAGIKFVPKQNDSVSEKDGSLQNDNTSPLLYLTDGWYGISAVVDCAMAQIIFENKIKIGTKLVIHGAELSGLSSPCHPLEAPSGSCLRLSTNMTRRARWWTRLGLLSCQGPFPVKLTSVLKDGGSVGKIKVMLSRIYPLVYFEKSNGSSIFRGEKAHLRLIKQHQRDKEDILQKVMRNIEREYEKENCDQQVNNFKSLTDEEISSLATGREIALLLETIPDPVRLDNILSAHQLELARSWQHCQAEDRRLKINSAVQRRMTEMQKTYEAVPVLKLRIVDVDGVEAVLSIWRPSEELRQALTEGLAFIIHYVMASGSRKGTLQLTATRQTRWECIDKGSPLSFPETFRVVSPLCLTASVNFNPQWKEVDVVGMVFKIGMVENGYQLVYLVDHLINIVTVKFWGSIKEHGDEDIIHLESILSLSNGSWRGHGNKKYGCIHVTELTAFSILPKSAHFVEAVAHFKESIKDMKALVQKANMKLNGQNTECTCPSLTKPHLDIACNHKCMGEQREYENRVSSPVDTDTGKPQAVSTPNRLEQHSKDLKRKMKALGQYGIPSPIRMFSTASSSVGTGKPFKVPLKQDSPSS